MPETDQFERYATFDKEQTLNGHGMGQYQCFCQINKKSKVEFCKEYVHDTNMIKISKQLTVILIVVVNVIAKVLIRKLVEKVGHKTLS